MKINSNLMKAFNRFRAVDDPVPRQVHKSQAASLIFIANDIDMSGFTCCFGKTSERRGDVQLESILQTWPDAFDKESAELIRHWKKYHSYSSSDSCFEHRWMEPQPR